MLLSDNNLYFVCYPKTKFIAAKPLVCLCTYITCFNVDNPQLYRYQQLIKENIKDIAKLITTEQGKTLPDAEGDVMRGLQVIIKTVF